VFDKRAEIIFLPRIFAISLRKKGSLSAAFHGEVCSSYNFRDLAQMAIGAPRFKGRVKLFLSLKRRARR
jgi:hypothetical protein